MIPGVTSRLIFKESGSQKLERLVSLLELSRRMVVQMVFFSPATLPGIARLTRGRRASGADTRSLPLPSRRSTKHGRMSTTAWTKGDRKARRQLEKSLKSDGTDDVTRFALVRLLANKADPVAAEVTTNSTCVRVAKNDWNAKSTYILQSTT